MGLPACLLEIPKAEILRWNETRVSAKCLHYDSVISCNSGISECYIESIEAGRW